MAESAPRRLRATETIWPELQQARNDLEKMRDALVAQPGHIAERDQLVRQRRQYAIRCRDELTRAFPAGSPGREHPTYNAFLDLSEAKSNAYMSFSQAQTLRNSLFSLAEIRTQIADLRRVAAALEAELEEAAQGERAAYARLVRQREAAEQTRRQEEARARLNVDNSRGPQFANTRQEQGGVTYDREYPRASARRRQTFSHPPQELSEPSTARPRSRDREQNPGNVYRPPRRGFWQ